MELGRDYGTKIKQIEVQDIVRVESNPKDSKCKASDHKYRGGQWENTHAKIIGLVQPNEWAFNIGLTKTKLVLHKREERR